MGMSIWTPTLPAQRLPAGMAARWRRATIALRAWSLRRLSGSSGWSFCLLAAALPAKLVSDGAWAWVHFVLAVLVLAPLALLSITHSTMRGEWPLVDRGDQQPVQRQRVPAVQERKGRGPAERSPAEGVQSCAQR